MNLTINVCQYLESLSIGISEECSNIKKLRLFTWEYQTYPCLLFCLGNFPICLTCLVRAFLPLPPHMHPLSAPAIQLFPSAAFSPSLTAFHAIFSSPAFHKSGLYFIQTKALSFLNPASVGDS